MKFPFVVVVVNWAFGQKRPSPLYRTDTPGICIPLMWVPPSVYHFNVISFYSISKDTMQYPDK